MNLIYSPDHFFSAHCNSQQSKYPKEQSVVLYCSSLCSISALSSAEIRLSARSALSSSSPGTNNRLSRKKKSNNLWEYFYFYFDLRKKNFKNGHSHFPKSWYCNSNRCVSFVNRKACIMGCKSKCKSVSKIKNKKIQISY